MSSQLSVVSKFSLTYLSLLKCLAKNDTGLGRDEGRAGNICSVEIRASRHFRFGTQALVPLRRPAVLRLIAVANLFGKLNVVSPSSVSISADGKGLGSGDGMIVYPSFYAKLT